MLSKLRHFDDAGGVDAGVRLPAPDENSFRMLGDALGAGLSAVAPVGGGTLGVCYTARLGAKPVFIKTHRADARDLAKEARLLAQAHGDALWVESREAAGRLWLVMDRLAPPVARPVLTDILSLTRAYAPRLDGRGCIPEGDTLAALLARGTAGVAAMLAAGMISPSCAQAVQSRFSDLGAVLPGLPKQACHGDLGPKNILVHGGTLIAVDWEDAFWGVAGYDYLYWLTFFENRALYGGDILEKTGLGRGVEVSIMALVVVLKSLLSWRAATHHGNTLSFDERIGEVLALG
ncbi:MAG: phosphotransferase [Rhodospirillales bacterium]|nr:phosphotransferase [Alphaproteobacteria bacterium]MCB9987191.1 phosphotransferase [Rhodospirillales bacterium]USO07947.1 MAG: phosphotransferase [Rhodospirillales bacterium]